MTAFHLPTATPDLPPPAHVRLADELIRCGWSILSHYPRRYQVWTKREEEIIIPLDPAVGDYGHMVFRAERQIAKVSREFNGQEAIKQVGDALELHAPTTVTIDGADSRNPEGEGNVTICRTCSDWDGSDLIGTITWPCATAKALGVRG